MLYDNPKKVRETKTIQFLLRFDYVFEVFFATLSENTLFEL